MQSAFSAATVYNDVSASVKTPRQIEYQAFAAITKKLGRSAQNGQADFPSFAEALHDNLRLWSILATDVAMEGNPLPKLLRAQLFTLAEFTRDHTRKVLRGEADANALIDINKAIMRGLRQQAEVA